MEEFKKYKFGDIVNILDSKRIPLSATQRENRKGIYPYYGAQGIISMITSSTVHISLLLKMAKI